MAAQSAQDKAAAAEKASTAKPAAAKDETVAGNQAAAGQTTEPVGPVVESDPVVTEAPAPKFSTHPDDVSADPRTGKAFGAVKNPSLAGTHGFEALTEPGSVVQGVDPDRIPAEVTPGVSPDAQGDRLLAAAQAKAPSLTREFVDAYKLSDEDLAKIARGEVPPPPTPGPIHTSDLYLTPGGWQQTPPGVPPQDVGGNQMHREA